MVGGQWSVAGARYRPLHTAHCGLRPLITDKTMKVLSYQELQVWQKAMQCTVELYALVKRLPIDERYGLSDQMRRAALSIPSNIAEGAERNSTKEFVRFIYVAQGSRAELETQLLLCERVGYLSETEIRPILGGLAEIGRMLHALARRLGGSG